MTFNGFWRWLCRQTRRIETLGGKSEFRIQAKDNKGTIVSSKGRKHRFSRVIARQVWGRYQKLNRHEKLRAGHYVDGPRDQHWNPCPSRFCSPWLAAAIRDFGVELTLAGKNCDYERINTAEVRSAGTPVSLLPKPQHPAVQPAQGIGDLDHACRIRTEILLKLVPNGLALGISNIAENTRKNSWITSSS